ncbi:hypothetical protein OROMI_000788 [Orobanche minor]
METRLQLTCLDAHVEQISQIQAEIEEIRSIMAIERQEEAEFRKMMLTWMKLQENQPSDGTSSVSDSSVHFPRSGDFVQFSGNNSNSDNTSAGSDIEP